MCCLKLSSLSWKELRTTNYALPSFGKCLTLDNRVTSDEVLKQSLKVCFMILKSLFIYIICTVNRLRFSPCGSSLSFKLYQLYVRSSNVPLYLKRRLVPCLLVMERCTTQDALLEMPKVRLELGKKGFSYVGLKACKAFLLVWKRWLISR